MHKRTAILIVAAALSACATAHSPTEPNSLASTWVLVGDASAERRPAISDGTKFAKDNPPKRLYWFLAGR